MSNHIIYGAIGFLLGGLVGGFFMGCLCGKEYKKKISQLEQENDILKNNRRDEKAKEFEAREKEVKQNRFDKMTAKEIIEKAGYKAPERKETEDDDEEDLELEEVEFDDPFDEDGAIRLITKEAYNEDIMTRDSETLTYYQQDGVLADAFDDAIHNQAEIIGPEGMERADETDEDAIYISNDIEDKVYEVVIEHSDSFYRDLGV